MNYYLLFLLKLSCCFAMSKSVSPDKEVMNTIHHYSKNLEKEGIINRWYGLRWAGPDKVYDGKIHEISLGYSIDRNLKYREARTLFYRIVDQLLSEINSQENLREYFFHYPVTYKDLHFAVSFDYKSKGHLKKDDIYQIVIQYNAIYYAIAQIDGAKEGLLFNETYPGMGTMTFTGMESTRSVLRKLPETEEEANATEAIESDARKKADRKN